MTFIGFLEKCKKFHLGLYTLLDKSGAIQYKERWDFPVLYRAAFQLQKNRLLIILSLDFCTFNHFFYF